MFSFNLIILKLKKSNNKNDQPPRFVVIREIMPKYCSSYFAALINTWDPFDFLCNRRHSLIAQLWHVLHII